MKKLPAILFAIFFAVNVQAETVYRGTKLAKIETNGTLKRYLNSAKKADKNQPVKITKISTEQ